VTGSSSQPPEPTDAQIVPPATPQPPAPDYDERGVPSLDYVRDKIEGRFATALGGTELAEGTPEARSIEEQQAQREAAAKAKLDEIRRTLE
jgi:phage shock protein A